MTQATDDLYQTVGAITATITTLGVIYLFFKQVALVGTDKIQEYTQSILAIIFAIGGGYLLAFHPEIDRAIVVGLISPVIAVYFGAKIALSSPTKPGGS